MKDSGVMPRLVRSSSGGLPHLVKREITEQMENNLEKFPFVPLFPFVP